MAQLDTAFQLCEPRGIKILIDMHWTPGGHQDSTGILNIFTNPAANDSIVAAWQRLVAHYKDRPGLFGYDLINEPIEPTPPTAGLDTRSTEIRIGNAIRAIDRKTPIFISFAQGEDPNAFKNPTPVPLTNVFYEMHMYLPHDFTGQDSTLNTYPNSTENQAYVANVLGMVRTFQTKYNVRIFVGEFSARRWAPGAATYLQDCINIFEGYGWSWCYHAYREDKGWSLEIQDLPISGAQPQHIPPTDRYNVVVGGGMSLNQ
jgi:aryl-phospho-beta-D-glucosidase BglC (GH1 family)